MNSVIRRAVDADLTDILPVVDAARAIMRASGNMDQWVDGYPSREVIAADIAAGVGRVITRGGRVVAYFAFIASPEPTYAKIYGGRWLDDTRPYHVVHRIASLPDAHGIFADMLRYCLAADANIRIDTHRDNLIMRHNLAKHGFAYCGIIYLANGDERLAFQSL